MPVIQSDGDMQDFDLICTVLTTEDEIKSTPAHRDATDNNSPHGAVSREAGDIGLHCIVQLLRLSVCIYNTF